MIPNLTPHRDVADSWHRSTSPVIVGKDLLGLLSSSMYVDPLTIYREYVQNAADAIDEARRVGLLSPSDDGRVDIFIDPIKRTVRIRDNGTGISRDKFEERLTGFGTSLKRGTEAEGSVGSGGWRGWVTAKNCFFAPALRVTRASSKCGGIAGVLNRRCSRRMPGSLCMTSLIARSRCAPSTVGERRNTSLR